MNLFLQDGRPAALYKNQGSIVMGTFSDLLHTEINLGPNEEMESPYIFITGDATQATVSDKGVNRGLDAQLSFARGQGNEPVPNPVTCFDGSHDLAWRIDYVGTAQIPGRVELCVDARKSRLYLKPKSKLQCGHLHLAVLISKILPTMISIDCGSILITITSSLPMRFR